MKITIEGTEKEIADFVLAVQNQQSESLYANEIAKELAEQLKEQINSI